ncbi:MAG: malectin domain-containing carbohydrate-binding protein, partial [Angustibacter sp.]
EIFATERWDPWEDSTMDWSFPVPSGVQVAVRLYFADRCPCSAGVGQRLFSVDLEGARVLDKFDVVASGGKDRGIVRSFAAISDGQLDIRFGHVANMPMISGIEILQTNPVIAPGPTAPALVARALGGSPAVGPTQLITTGGLDWTAVRGMFAVDDAVFYGLTDGTFHRRSFDGRTLGPDTVVDPYNDPFWSNKSTGKPAQTYRGVVPGLYGQLANVTSAFFASGRLYYTLAGRTTMFYRSFNPESGIMGPIENTVLDGLNWSGVSGAFATSDALYFVTAADGVLRRYAWSGTQASGSAVVVDSSTSWAGRSIFLRSGLPSPPKQTEQVTFREASTASARETTALEVAIPPSVQAGDALLLFTSVNLASTSTDPAGWRLLGTRSQTNSITTKVYARVAATGDAGSRVPLRYPAPGKITATLVAYSGADRTSPVAALAEVVDADTADHATPPVIVPTAALGGRALSFWVDKSASPATEWTVPSGTIRRAVSFGSGAGSVSTQLAETAAVLGPGTAPSRTASVNVAGGKGLSWTILLKPASAG